MIGCKFCEIVAGSVPAHVVYRDADCMAFTPLDPVSKGHTLLIPKKHFISIFDVDVPLFGRFAEVMALLSRRLVSDSRATAINVLNANGPDAQQSVPHLHFHLVPRYPDDRLDLWMKQRL